MPVAIHDQFRAVFAHSPDAVVQAPGRINLIGEHVDYLDGLVMPAAIDRSIMAAARRTDDAVVRVWTELTGEIVTFGLDELTPRGGSESWLNYLIGVLAKLRDADVKIPGFEAAFASDLPTGAGLSSSAALETATALIVEALTGVSQEPIDRALICQKAEHDFAGVPCGIMDQLAVGASRAGHALMIDCRDLSLTPVPIPDGVTIVVADTQVKHALGDGEYRKRREDCEAAAAQLGVSTLREATLAQVIANEATLEDRLLRRARHAVTEIARVNEFADALSTENFSEAGLLMRASHDSLRDDFDVSCEELDALVEAAYDFGADRGLIGSRMTGGGFGGSTVSLIRDEAQDAFVEHLGIAFSKKFDHPASIFTTQAADGARIL